jgi:hypothetical protein
MYIGYGGKDQFNIAAQVESFLYRARERGLSVSVCYVPEGKHNLATALKIWPDARAWLSSHLAAYAPISGVPNQILIATRASSSAKFEQGRWVPNSPRTSKE